MKEIKRERCYETMFIVKQSLSKEEIENKIASIKANIEKNGGAIDSEFDMGMRELAYPIEKENKGYYYIIYFKIDSAKIEELNRLNRIDENLIRFIFIKYESKSEVEHYNTRSEMAKKGQIEVKPPKITPRAPRAPRFDKDAKRDDRNKSTSQDKSTQDSSEQPQEQE